MAKRWLGFGRPSSGARERDAERELADHLELEADEQRAAGVSGGDARRAAVRAFGNATRVREELRAIHGTPRLDEVVSDLRYARRTLGAAPAVTLLAVGSSALGIGACSVLFAVLNAAVLRPLPVAAPDRLVSISELDRRTGEVGNELSYPDYVDVRKAASFEDVAAVSPFVPASIDAHDNAERHWGAIATANYFAVVQPRFELGRGFDVSRDDVPGESAAIVLSHGLWQSRFHGDRNVVGRAVGVNGRPATVVGVTAAGFESTEGSVAPEFWIPFSLLPDLEARMGPISRNRGRHWLSAVGRLRAGVDASAARAELDVIAGRLNTAYRAGKGDRTFHVERAGQLEPELRSMAAAAFAIALGIVMLVQITGCANVANLLLGRLSARGREMAARMALGASRGRLIRQLLTESLLLALLGGIGGWVIAYWVCPMIGLTRDPLGWPRHFSVALDGRVLLFCTGWSAVTGIAFGLLPALQATRTNLVAALKSDGRGGGGIDRGLTRNALLVAQVAACAVLLLCSGLALRSLQAATALDLGFANRNVLLLVFDPGLESRPDEESRALLRDVLDRTQAMAGVESATLTTAVPLTFIIDNSDFVAEGADATKAARVRTDIYAVGPRFFETFGIAVQSGEALGAAHGPRRIAVVNQAFARAVFGDAPPIGRRILGDGKALDVVGVAATAKSRTIGESPRPAIFLPILTEYVAGHARRGVTLAVRTSGAPLAYAQSLRQAIRGVDPSLAVFDVRTIETHIADALLVPRLLWGIAAAAGVIGLGLAIVGMYGVISFAVARRTRELGIRLAIGALPREVLMLVLRQGLTLAAAGTALGIAVAFGLSRFAASLLYEVAPADPVTFAIVPVIVLAVTVAACLVPARAAARLDPVEVLRSE